VSVPLAHDRTGQIMGIDMVHHGLFCRYAKGCRVLFRPLSASSMEHLADAGIRRDVHERIIHGYEHPKYVAPRTWGYGDKISRDGRSTLGKKPNHHGPLERMRVPR
jgi:hypothetical protein